MSAILYVYADGYDLHADVAAIFTELSSLVARWGVKSAFVVNERHVEQTQRASGDLAAWNLGLNASCDEISERAVSILVESIEGIARRVRRDFVLGIQRSIGSPTEDILFIDHDGPCSEIHKNALIAAVLGV